MLTRDHRPYVLLPSSIEPLATRKLRHLFVRMLHVLLRVCSWLCAPQQPLLYRGGGRRWDEQYNGRVGKVLQRTWQCQHQCVGHRSGNVCLCLLHLL